MKVKRVYLKVQKYGTTFNSKVNSPTNEESEVKASSNLSSNIDMAQSSTQELKRIKNEW